MMFADNPILTELDHEAVARFFKAQALSLISDDLKQQP
jgi:hypothetical protein